MATNNLNPRTPSREAIQEDSHDVSDSLDLMQIDDSDSMDRWPNEVAEASESTKNLNWICGALLSVAVITAAIFYARKSEQGHANWKHVAAASAASTSFAQQLQYVDKEGNAEIQRSISVSEADKNITATQQIRSALWRSDLVSATASLQAAQSWQALADTTSIVATAASLSDLSLSSLMSDGNPELFEIELFDCCDEDGDVVEVLVNGTPFANVPLAHGGTVLAIPLNRGLNSITVVAIRDGGGGVTVSLRTSHGEYFARYMDEGESHQMGVVVK